MELPNINTLQKLKTWKPKTEPTQAHVDEAKHWLRHNVHRPLNTMSKDEYLVAQNALLIVAAKLGHADYKRFLKSIKKPTP